MPAQATPTLDVKQLFERYAQVYATRDPDAIVALHSPDGEFWLHTGGQPVRGREAIRDIFAGLFRQWPEFGFDVYRLFVGEGHWVLDWALTAVLRSPGDEARPVRFDCLDIVAVDEAGLVNRKDAFVDAAQAQAAIASAAR